ncbi:hypothetical protein [Streptomyces sp. NPDC005732]|uniref:hypothetical protein n=1 Tax=Streptomyces sp. NPDC005732 TaxID=3157057 RepID=UPI0033DDCEC1
MSTWSVRVDFEGADRVPLGLRVHVDSPEEALAIVKESVRDILLASEEPGGSEYTIGVFEPDYRAGDESVLAEKISLVTMRR